MKVRGSKPVKRAVVTAKAGHTPAAVQGRDATPAPKGLIDVPSPPKAPVATAVAARPVKAFFDGFMKMRRFELDVSRPGSSAIETRTVDVLSGPGHNCSMAAPLVLGAD